MIDTGVRLLTGQEVSLKTIGNSFVEGCVASAAGLGSEKVASKVTSAVGKYAINKAGGAAARTAVGIMRGDSLGEIGQSVAIGLVSDNILDGVSATFSKIRAQRANVKTTSTKSSTTRNIRTIKGSGKRKTNNSSFVPDSYWQKKASKYGVPGTKNIHFRYNPDTKKVERSLVIYDFAGRQSMRIDYTTHGRPSSHLNPHIHVNTYNRRYPDGYSWRIR